MCMKKTKTRLLTIVACILVFASLLATASAIGPLFASTNSGVFSNSVEAWCQVGFVATGDYGTTKGKKLSNCYVRLQEGNYDSGRLYGTQWADATDFKRAYVSKWNNPAYTCYGNWGWVYQ
mgnify:CR=1 FL=1